VREREREREGGGREKEKRFILIFFKLYVVERALSTTINNFRSDLVHHFIN